MSLENSLKKLFLILIFLMTALSVLFGKTTRLKINDVVVISDCDQVINDPLQRKCYLFKAQKPRFNFYYLTPEIINGSIKKRLSFKDDKRLKVPNYIKCYYKSGKDRGHLAPDASFDYNYTLLKTTYLSSNIVPEDPYPNRYLISKIEKEFRALIDKYGPGYIITGAHFKYTEEFKFNPNNKYGLDCGYYPDYIYKILYIPKTDIFKVYKITNTKPYKIIPVNNIQFIKFLKENNLQIIFTKKSKNFRFYR